MFDPNPLDEEGSIGRDKVSAFVLRKIDVKRNAVDFSAVFVVLSLKLCHNWLPPAVTILLC